MNYCQKCVLPDTRPNLAIMPDGICNACHSWVEKQQNIDWSARENEFQKLVTHVKAKASAWDCVIPVSGGKDSTWQVIKALEYGLKPLCVTWRTPARNVLGQKNLDNLIQLGVDHIDFSINPKVEKKLSLNTFKKAGSLAIPMHMALFAIPLQTAIKHKIPLVLWGENSGMEYGGSNNDLLGFKMTHNWLKTYGVTQGTVAQDWVDNELTLKALASYIWPTDAELEAAGVTASFLGWYFPWDPVATFKVAQQHGFLASTEKPKTGLYNFADVDDEFIITIHHWLKWYKFGFTRLWDNLSLEIRSGRMTRKAAIEVLMAAGNDYPQEAIQKFCAWAEISEQEFNKIADTFRNESIWFKENNKWKLKEFLFEEWAWI
jgi:N-acetyl sugar amidotransferase